MVSLQFKGKNYGKVPSHQQYLYEWMGFKPKRLKVRADKNGTRIRVTGKSKVDSREAVFGG